MVIRKPKVKFMEQFKHVCWLHTQFNIHRYLMSNADGRLDGAEKAHRHMQLCYFYVAAIRGLEESDHEVKCGDDFDAVHDKTADLTSFLDEEIGFPLKGVPDYDKLAPLFFDKFHALAIEALSV